MNQKYQKEDILDIGTGLLRRNGYHHTGINEVLKATGIPKGSFYNYFSSKEDFMEQALDYYGAYTLEFMQSFLRDETRPPLQRLRAFYQGLIDANRQEGFAFGCLVGNTSTEVGGLNETIAQAAERQLQGWIRELSQCISQGQDLGQIRTDFQAEELAAFIHTSFLGALGRMKTTRSGAPLETQFHLIFTFISL